MACYNRPMGVSLEFRCLVECCRLAYTGETNLVMAQPDWSVSSPGAVSPGSGTGLEQLLVSEQRSRKNARDTFLRCLSYASEIAIEP